MAEIALVLW